MLFTSFYIPSNYQLCARWYTIYIYIYDIPIYVYGKMTNIQIKKTAWYGKFYHLLDPPDPNLNFPKTVNPVEKHHGFLGFFPWFLGPISGRWPLAPWLRLRRAAVHCAQLGRDRARPGDQQNAGVHRCFWLFFFYVFYPLVNKQLDPENHQFLMETNLPTPMTGRVYVNLPEGICCLYVFFISLYISIYTSCGIMWDRHWAFLNISDVLNLILVLIVQVIYIYIYIGYHGR